ncbi:MAG TPA: DNA repair protein RadC [Bacteroidota bacterium]|jgi:DNA repair protein RadC
MSNQKVGEPPFGHSRITDWPVEERPREKLMLHGAGSLSDAELLAILLQTGVGKATAVDVAKSLLREFRSLERMTSRSFRDLRRLKGVGNAKSIALVAAFELGRRASSRRDPQRAPICSPEDVVQHYQPLLRDLQQEVFKVLLLDSANHLLADETISVGILNGSLVHPREVFRRAILEPAASIILLHNHPSGNPEPSSEDIQVTRQLCEAGKIMGIPVHDHIILALHSYSSFAERGLL